MSTGDTALGNSDNGETVWGSILGRAEYLGQDYPPFFFFLFVDTNI